MVRRPRRPRPQGGTGSVPVGTSPDTGRSVTSTRWRTRRSAALAGLVFAILLITALMVLRSTISGASVAELAADPGRRRLVRFGLGLLPFAGIAFLWFIGVIRDQVGAVEDRLFSSVFLGSGLLFLAMLFLAAVISTALLEQLDRPGGVAALSGSGVGTWDVGREASRVLVSGYAMRMAAVFTLSVSTLVVRTRAVPRWVAVLGYLVASALLVAGGDVEWVQLSFPAWVLVLSVVILLTRPDADSQTGPSANSAAEPPAAGPAAPRMP